MASKSKEVAPVAEADLEPLSPEEEALIAQNQSESNPDEFIIPLLKLTQPLTAEVVSGDARPGEFFLPLTGENFEKEIEFVVAGKGKGRFKGGKKGERTLVSEDGLVPWKDDPFFGQPFSEHPDAEESYSARANSGEIEWGSGPPIQTTANYTGFIVGSDVPVRFSMKLANKFTKGEARKWNTLLDAVLRGRYWDKVFTLSSVQESNSGGQAFYVAKVSQARSTTPEERKAAVELATVLRSRDVTIAGDESDAKSEVAPDAEGGLSV